MPVNAPALSRALAAPRIGRILAVAPRIGLALAVAVGCSSCGPIVKPAPFPHRPDSVEPAFMLGPYEGRVVDADSGRPIEGALVVCSWGFDRGVGNTAPEAERTRETRTDPDGHYRIARLRDLPGGLSTRLARFSLIVYQRGYVAYRNDRIFQPRWRRRDFAQRNNLVKLARWSPELSHARHLLFVGGTPSLREAIRWEQAAAALELAGDARPKPLVSDLRVPGARPDVAGSPPPPGQASRLLSSDEVRAITGFNGAFELGRLSQADDATDSLHLKAKDRPERYDVALRLWRLSGAELQKRYEALLAALPGSKQEDVVGDRSFAVAQGEITGLGLLKEDAGALVLITCGKGQCTDPKMLRRIAEKVEDNLRRLPAQ